MLKSCIWGSEETIKEQRAAGAIKLIQKFKKKSSP
jgi:hypothetical protein